MLQRVLFIALLSIFGFSCANSQNTETKKSEKSETKGLVMKMDQKLFLEKIFDYKKQNQEWKYESDKPSIIDFYADWCAPCRKVAPILDELAEEYKGKINFYKVDTEKEKELSREMGIRSLPTLLYCPVNGQPQIIMGLQPKENYIQAIKEIFNVQ